MAEIFCQDVLKWAAWYSGPKFHALLCDPPYHLITQDKRGINYTERMRHRNNPEYEKTLQRAGFMGKTWDGGDVAFQPSTWAAIAEHLLPGAFGMAFSGARTYHRMVRYRGRGVRATFDDRLGVR